LAMRSSGKIIRSIRKRGYRPHALSSRQQVLFFQYLRQAVRFWNVDEKAWHLEGQFQRSGCPLSWAEREQLLLRSHHLLCDSSSHALDTQRVHYLREYLFQHAAKEQKGRHLSLYPWEDLEDHLRKTGGTIKLFGFGSLINAQSASYNICKRRGPAIAFGLKRIFNYKDHYLESCNIGCPNENCMQEQAKLNAADTKDPNHMINGILYDITAEDLNSLRPRERGYDLERLYVVDHYDALDESCTTPRVYEAYLLRARNENQVSYENVPDINYLNVCLEGARSFGKPFLKLFFDTTYLCDGVTPMKDWLINNVRELASTSYVANPNAALLVHRFAVGQLLGSQLLKSEVQKD